MMAGKVQGKKLVFPLLSKGEILDNLQSLMPDLVLDEKILTDQSQIIQVYKRFLTHYGVNMDGYQEQLFGPMHLHSDHRFDYYNIYQFLKTFERILHIDLYPADVILAGTYGKRTRKILSAMINFMCFTRDQKENFAEQVKEDSKKKKQQFKEQEDEIRRLEDMKSQMIIKKEESDLEKRQMEMERESLFAAYQHQVERRTKLKKDAASKKEQVAGLESDYQNLMTASSKLNQEEEDLKKMVVKSPEKIVEELETARKEFESAKQKEHDTLVADTDINRQLELYEENLQILPQVAQLKEKTVAILEKNKTHQIVRNEVHEKQKTLDELRSLMASRRATRGDTMKSEQSVKQQLKVEETAWKEELSRLRRSIADKSENVHNLSEGEARLQQSIGVLQESLQELQGREEDAVKEAIQNRDECMDEKEKFEHDYLLLVRNYVKLGRKFIQYKSDDEQ